MLILAFSLAMPLDAMVAQQPQEQVKKSQKQSIVPKKSLRGHIQQFIRKHKTTLATIGALGAFLLIAYLVPQAKLNKGQPWHRLLYSKDWLNVAIEGKHFAVNPYGEIDWIKTASAQ